MDLFKKILTLLVCLYFQYFLNSFTTANDLNTIRMTNIGCFVNTEFFSEKIFCRLKPYRNRTVGGTIKFLIIKEIPHITVNFELLIRENGYKPSFINLTQDGCRFFENKNSNPFMKAVLKWLGRRTYPENIRCPLQRGKLEFYDIFPDLDDIPSLVPVGDFLLLAKFYDLNPYIEYVTVKINVNIGMKNLLGPK